ncbi:hypothetical protein BDN67DRAFT_981905 [Paxillus ammoniavirescens]|nr:hypothetical protein BDN67DRAFT_981905 [Paxillus ammoniavirescens]
MSRYLNPLHPPVPTEIHSQYTALSYANPPLQPPFPIPLPSSYKRVPQTVPPRLLSAPCRSSPRIPITFNLIGATNCGLGVPMRELLVRSDSALERMLVDAKEPVGSLMAGSLGTRKVSLTIALVVQWPGYEHVEWTLCFDLFTPSGPLTRGQLAVQIANAFSGYVVKVAGQTPSPNAASWRLASGGTGTSFDRLVLTAFWNVRDDHWMAEVLVDLR